MRPGVQSGAPPRPVVRELLLLVVPLVAFLLLAGWVASHLQHGFLIGGSNGVPLAGPDCSVTIPHLLLLGLVAGYAMALIGGATGLLTLPYAVSVLGFTTVNVSPTVQFETFLNPLGALLGFRRSRQLNLSVAAPLCFGAIFGAVAGSVLRVTWLSQPAVFKTVLGLALLFVGTRLFRRIFSAVAMDRRPARFSPHPPAAGEPSVSAEDELEPSRADRLARSRSSRLALGGIGAAVAVVGASLGVGGAFLLVPILAECYRLPMRVISGISIPFVIVLSATGIASYNLLIPPLLGVHASPEWAWGFFTGGAGVLGSWFAAVSQHFVPDTLLKLLLAISSTACGVAFMFF